MNHEAGDWLTIEDAARRLGMSPAAIRSRVQRKTLRSRPGRQSNDGKVRVWVPADAATMNTDDAPVKHRSDAAMQTPMQVEELVELGQLRGRVGELEERVVELRAELVEERAGRERERTEARLERQALLSVIEGMARAARPVSWFDRVNEWIRSRSRPAD